MASSAQELDALASALNRSAERLQTLWFSFLALTLYFAISALTTTHRMLFLEESQTLPILNVKLPLLPFYVIAPAFYVVLHAYMLMMLVLLARTARTFEGMLNAGSLAMTDKDRERYRMRMENAIFLQIIAGARRERSGANGWVLRRIALLSIAVAPVLVLLLFQVMFLPYHSERITWLHRGLVLVDLVLIWTLWPSYRQHGGERMLPSVRPPSDLLDKIAATLVVVVFSLFLATFPHEWINRFVNAESAPMRALFGGPWDSAGIFSNRLWLPNEDFVDDDKLKRISLENKLGDWERPSFVLDLSNRNLAEANLRGADLRRVNFSGRASNLRGAMLDGAWLQGSSFEGAQMQNATLRGALLQGASFSDAELQLASLSGAELSGANLFRAKLHGAFLDHARLVGADLDFADFRGATLRWAQLQGAALSGASLEGASLGCAQLQGANLRGARLQGSWLGEIHTSRVTGRPERTWPTLLAKPRADAQHYVELDRQESMDEDGGGHGVTGGFADCGKKGKLPFSGWLEETLREIPEGRAQSRARERLRALDPRNQFERQLKEDYWHMMAETQPAGEAFQEEMARILEKAACEPSRGPYIAMGIIHNGLLETVGHRYLARFVELFDEAARSRPADKIACPGARWLPEGYLHALCDLDVAASVSQCADRRRAGR